MSVTFIQRMMDKRESVRKSIDFILQISASEFKQPNTIHNTT